jgi:hypothetical protein
METVQVQCGSCGRVMAISVEHLGSQVHCPHCQAIVQAPSAGTPAPAPAPEIAGEDGETASIFAGPDVGDDIFNSGPSGPFVEMPLEKSSSPPPAPVSEEPMGTKPWLPGPKVADFNSNKITDEFTQSVEPPPAPAWTDDARVAEEGPADQANLAALQRRRVEKKSALAAVLLIFLVPYAILATLVIAYLLYHQGRAYDDPLERLPDPNPKNGGPRLQERVKHDSILPDKLKIRLGQSLQIGVLQVTPVKVRRTENDELILHLKMKNVSSDLLFNPVSADFLKYAPGSLSANRPYTYLDSRVKKIYGGYPEWLQGPEGNEELHQGGDIGPGHEEWVRIVTDLRDKNAVKSIAASNENLVWRVQVRRGFVEVRGKQVSATAVVGVEFNASAIQKEG